MNEQLLDTAVKMVEFYRGACIFDGNGLVDGLDTAFPEVGKELIAVLVCQLAAINDISVLFNLPL